MYSRFVGLTALILSLGIPQAVNGKASVNPESPPMERNAWFMENQGQIRDQSGKVRSDIDFRIMAHSQLSVFIHSQGMDYQWYFPEDSFSYRMEVRIIGANPHSRPRTELPKNYTEHYYLEGEAMTSRAWERIVYPEIYPGIDWILYKKGKQLEYDFLVRPGADIEQIQLEYRGAESLNLTAKGELMVRTLYSQLIESAPIGILEGGQTIDCSFLVDGNRMGFRTAPYQGSLLIDPVVEWGTYLGGTLNDIANQVARSSSGMIYMTGGTTSISNIATVGAFHQSYQGGTGGLNFLGDAFLAQFDSTGQCLWSTYFGGTSDDQGFAVATDGQNGIYMAGATRSSAGIATSGAHQTTNHGGADAFLAKFREDGTLIWSTYYGGTGDENLWVTMSCQEGGPVYLAFPTTSSTGISSPGAHQEVFGGLLDAGLVQFDSSGAFQWGTYFGGTGMDIPFQVQADDYGHVYLAGFTGSTTQIATPGTHQPASGGGDDGYVAKFNDQGHLIWSSYYGGTGTDRLVSVYPVSDTAVYLLGVSNSNAGIATSSVHQPAISGGDDAFFVRLDTAGQRQWGSYFGGSSNEYPTPSLALGIHGDLYFGGSTQSNSGIASPGAMNPLFQGGMDGMLVRFSPQGQIKWSTYVGGPGIDIIQSIDTDPLGYIYLCGETTSGTGIADSTSHQSSFGGGYRDAILLQIADCDTPATPGAIQGPALACPQQPTTYTVPPVPGAQSYLWTLPAGWAGSSQTNQIVVYPGHQSGQISVQALSYCQSSTPSSLSVQASLVASISHSGEETLCVGDTLVLTGGIGATAYEWLWNGQALSTDSILHATDTGSYQLVVHNSQCTDSSAILKIQYWPQTPPKIHFDGNYLVTENHYVQYQWYYDNQPITGANQYRWKPVAMGPYKVVVLDSNGCIQTSELYPMSLSGRERTTRWKVYPNPARTQVQVQIPGDIQGQFIMINAQGQTVLTTRLNARISLDGILPGIYWVLIRDESGNKLHSQILVKD